MGIVNWLAGGLEWVLESIVSMTGSYGVAIILTTILVRLVLYPLTLSQTKSMVAMKELQPKMKELEKKYKAEPQEYQKRAMELYKEHKVNPLGGCLPMLIQLPFLWAFFRVLQTLSPSDATQFLGIWELSVPDPYYVLPILSAATTYWQMTTSATDPNQKTMMFVMPVMIGVFSLSFPAGLVLYWIVSSVFQVAQQYWITKQRPVDTQGGQAK